MINKTLRAYVEGIVQQAIVAIGNAQELLMFNVRTTLDALATKADKEHTHPVTEITNLSRTYLADDIYWDAFQNQPRLPDPTSCKGRIYVVSAGGTRKLGATTYTFMKDDWVLSTGTAWIQVSHGLPPEVLRTDIAATIRVGHAGILSDDGTALEGEYVPDLRKGHSHEVHISKDTTLLLPILPTGANNGTMAIHATSDLAVGTVALTPVAGYRIMHPQGGLRPEGEAIYMPAGAIMRLELTIWRPNEIYIQVRVLSPGVV